MTPRNLDELRAVRGAAERVVAAQAYIAAGLVALEEARGIRDEELRRLADEVGVTAAARVAGLSVSHVKAVRRG